MKRILSLLLLLLAAAGHTPAAAAAGTLRVQLVNGTPGGGPVAGLPLTLYSDDGGRRGVAGRGQSGPDGAFAWHDLGGSLQASYVVSTTYGGVAYYSEPLGAGVAAVTLRVYEPTDDAANLSISSAGLVVLDADPATQVIRLLGTLTMRNAGDRTFRPGTSGASGAMGLLHFGLPAGAGNLAPQGELAASTIIQVDRGFASDLPLPPGEKELSYLYELGYGALAEGGYAELSSATPYPIDQLRVLVAGGEFSVESLQLRPAGTTPVGGKEYRLFEATDLPAHAEVRIELRNLPLNSPFLRAGNPWLRLLVALLLVAALALPPLYLRRARLAAEARARVGARRVAAGPRGRGA